MPHTNRQKRLSLESIAIIPICCLGKKNINLIDHQIRNKNVPKKLPNLSLPLFMETINDATIKKIKMLISPPSKVPGTGSSGSSIYLLIPVAAFNIEG